MRDLSVLIPSRNEMFLGNTVEDVLAHARADTEVIVVLDGAWPVEPIRDDPRVVLVHRSESIGQRAATNEAARVSQARYVMKLDAHCSVAEGFDVALIEAAKDLGPYVTQVPAQKNLHAFDWVCDACGWRKYQGPTPEKCEKCGAAGVRRELVWLPRKGVTTTAWRFDSDLHFQYWSEYQKRPEAQVDVSETMSCLGACFFMSRYRYWQLEGLDEAHGSWGQMGTEVACKSWLSGGRLVCNKRTWYAHMFRTQGGDFSFPYEISARDQDRARAYSQDLWRGDRWPGQKLPLTWLVERFAPVPTWGEDAKAAVVAAPGPALPAGPGPGAVPSDGSPAAGAPRRGKELTRGIVYYSDCRGDEAILDAARRQVLRAAPGLRVVSVTLAPLDFGDNVVLPLERGVLTMFRQILAGLEAQDADVVYFCEHDVLYHPSHFEFVPPRGDTYYYNRNTWKVDAASGHALFYVTDQTSGLCAYRDVLVEHYRARVERVESEGYDRNMGYEPGKHRRPRGVDDRPFDWWMSAVPNVDVRHAYNLTRNRWRQDQFRDKRTCQGWTEAEEVPGWGKTGGRFAEWLREAVP